MIKFKSKELNLLVESGKFVDEQSRDFIKSALGLKKKKVEAKRHTILSGPPGVGKTYGTQDECNKGNVKYIKIDPGTSDINTTIRLACGVHSLKKNEELIVLLDDADDVVFGSYETLNKWKIAMADTDYEQGIVPTYNHPVSMTGTLQNLQKQADVDPSKYKIINAIKAWVPTNLPDETQSTESDQVDWRFHMLETNSGEYQEVVVSDVVFNFASGYFSINDGLIKATGTHPIWVWDAEIQKYKFKLAEDILPADKIVKYDEFDGVQEIEVYNIEIVTEDVEIVTLNVENFDVYLANGTISHNKGTTTQPYIPSSGLRMYLDPSKASSTDGTVGTDWLDLTGYGTGVRPAGAPNGLGISGGNPTYNNGASRKEKYWSLDTNKFWYKDGSSNINGGYTQFNTTAYSVIAWVRFTSHPANGYYQIFGKHDNGASPREIAVYLNSNGSGTYFIHDGTTVQFNSNTFTLSLNTWYMVTYTAALNGTNVAYTDTTSRGTVSNGSKNYTTSGLIQIGGGYGDNNYYFNGQFGPVLFYNTQLSGTDITQVYNYFQPTYRP